MPYHSHGGPQAEFRSLLLVKQTSSHRLHEGTKSVLNAVTGWRITIGIKQYVVIYFTALILWHWCLVAAVRGNCVILPVLLASCSEAFVSVVTRDTWLGLGSSTCLMHAALAYVQLCTIVSGTH